MESINLLTPKQLLEGFPPKRYKISEAVKFNDNFISDCQDDLSEEEAVKFNDNCNSDCQDDLSESESDYSRYSDSDSDSDWLDHEVQEVFKERTRPRFDSMALKNMVKNQIKFNEKINKNKSKNKNTRKFLKLTLKDNELYVILGKSMSPFHSNLEDNTTFYRECIIDNIVTDIFYNIIKYDNYLDSNIIKFDVAFPGCKDFGNRIIQKCKERCCAEDMESFQRALLNRILTPLI